MTRNCGWRRWAAGAVVAAAGWAGPAAADDPLAQVKALRQVADQKADADVREAVRRAEIVGRSSPLNGIKQLNQVILSLDLATEISSQKRTELVALAQARIAALGGRPAPPPPPDPKVLKRRDDANRAAEAFAAEAKDVRAGVLEIEKLAALNKVQEVSAKIAELARKYPNNPAVLELVGQGRMADRVAAAHALAKEQEDRVAYVFNDVARSALPSKGDMEFPKNWADITKRRRDAEIKLDAATEAILKALEQPVKTGLKDAPFEETVQTLSNSIDKPIYLDKRSLEEAGLDLKRAVTMPGNVTARTALRAVLQAQGLTYIIKDGAIQVVTLEKAQATLVTRSYYLGDIVSGTGPFGGAVTWGPAVDFQQSITSAQAIIDAIKKSIDPLIWKEQGGAATIVFHAPSLSIIVRAPAEVHATLGGKLK